VSELDLRDGEDQSRGLVGVLGATIEVIASVRARPSVVGSPDLEMAIDGLRQLGRCAYHLAEELAARAARERANEVKKEAR
jgi:hypothetical protein